MIHTTTWYLTQLRIAMFTFKAKPPSRELKRLILTSSSDISLLRRHLTSQSLWLSIVAILNSTFQLTQRRSTLLLQSMSLTLGSNLPSMVTKARLSICLRLNFKSPTLYAQAASALMLMLSLVLFSWAYIVMLIANTHWSFLIKVMHPSN